VDSAILWPTAAEKGLGLPAQETRTIDVALALHKN